jgi:hypothetical protein
LAGLMRNVFAKPTSALSRWRLGGIARDLAPDFVGAAIGGEDLFGRILQPER